MGLISKVADLIADGTRYFDRYPKLITFTYNRRDEFRTIIGGVVSIATYVVLILYSYLMVRIMFERSDTANNISLVVNDIIDDTNPYELKDI